MKFYFYKVVGVVQGVGFRPYIRNACTAQGIHGYVQNTSDGVLILTDGTLALEKILNDAPLPIKITSWEKSKSSEHADSFSIKPSTTAQSTYSEIPPDRFLCPSCESDLMDPANRRHGYFFITCTSCGPRFSIVTKSPFDRANTTMNGFPLCPTCKSEYDDPSDRRFHAQTIACKSCGPTLSLFEHGRQMPEEDDDAYIKKIAIKISQGEVVAIKGVGGFHLACAMEKASIQRLNDLRQRSGKPYAVMCTDIEMAKTIAEISEQEAELLLSPARPIVLLKKKGGGSELSAVSELDTIGIMLPYTAIHHLLFKHYDTPIVMTSSNKRGEPISIELTDQCVPTVLNHDREIENAVDDSVVKVVAGHPLVIRRSRGYVPQSLQINKSQNKAILALGAEMNNTFALSDHSGRLTLSSHMGNTANGESFDRYKESIQKFLKYTNVKPDIIAHDLHPEYNTSKYARVLSEQFGIPLVAVQHHVAHIYSVALEHHLSDFVGIACDGLGYGNDGNIWGGEVFSNGNRIGHLEEQLQLGGDSATRYPHKMLYAILRNFLSIDNAKKFIAARYDETEVNILEKQLSKRFNTPLSSSCGRVLDAASALLGFCDERTYDGRPAMLLESRSSEPYLLPPVIENNILMTTPLFKYLVQNLDKDKGHLSATVERYLAQGLFEIAQKENKPIVFAGGCAYNRTMSSFMIEHGVHLNKEIPSGDGGISAGQIAFILNSEQKRF